MTGIVGSGFGIYGYLPAVLDNENIVVLLEKSRPVFFSRHELLHLADRVVFIADLDFFFSSITTLIIAVPPAEQFDIVHRALMYPNIEWLSLEKPMAKDPGAAIQLDRILKENHRNYAVCYLFLYTNWYEKLHETVASNETESLLININWQFQAHHYKNDVDTWKRKPEDGGGVIRFYGIHMIAVLASLGFHKKKSFCSFHDLEGDLSLWEAEFAHPSGIKLLLSVDSFSDKEAFEITIADPLKDADEQFYYIAQLESPVANAHDRSMVDPRARLLSKYLRDSYKQGTENAKEIDLYSRVNLLWKDIETQ
jgi:hypothetical protein